MALHEPLHIFDAGLQNGGLSPSAVTVRLPVNSGCARRRLSSPGSSLKYFTWDNAKNEKLKAERAVCFEDVVFHIERGDILDILEHPNQERYRGQRVIVVQIDDYAYLAPCVHQDEYVVLKTIIPSRKATRKYIHGEGEGDEA